MAVIGITGSTDGTGGASRWAPRPASRTHAGEGNPPRKHWVATSLWWLANRAVQVRLHSLCPLPEELGHRGRYGTRV